MLVLDEPTNDLDIDTLELLESLLQEFAGTLFLVSHDRAFLENTVTQVIAFEGNGVLTEFGGGYDDWQRYTMQRIEDKKLASMPAIKTKPLAPNIKPSNTKLSFKEQKELDDLLVKIDELSAKQSQINLQLADAKIFNEYPVKAQALQVDLIDTSQLLENLLARWEVLEAKR